MSVPTASCSPVRSTAVLSEPVGDVALSGDALMRVKRRLSVMPASGALTGTSGVHGSQGAPERFIQEAKEQFMRLDANGDGMLDFAEVKGLLQKGKPEMTERHLRRLFMSIDKNGDDRVDFDEFVDFVFSSDLADSRQKLGRRTRQRRKFNQWSGAEVLFVNGSWDAETKRALQRFLLAQQTPTARAAGERFVTGNWASASTFALQEFLVAQRLPSAVSAGATFATGSIDFTTTRALHELMLEMEVPTAMKIGPHLLDGTFGYSTVCALQEFLVLFRNANDPRN